MHVSVRGIRLNVETVGAGAPLLLLHGFMGSAATWSGVVEHLSRAYGCLMLDLPGHGQSDSPSDWRRYTLEECTSDAKAVLDVLDIRRAAVLGYSMGGRLALSLATTYPSTVSVLICESTNPGLEEESERKARTAADEALADVIEQRGMKHFVNHWESLPLFASQRRLSSQTQARIRSTRLATAPQGAANSLRGLSQGRQRSLWRDLHLLHMPALLLAGDEDSRYCDIAERTRALIKDSELAIVQQSGHAVHEEQPAPFCEVVLDFLTRKFVL